MKALVIQGKGGPEVLHLQDVPAPHPNAWEVKIAVRASALNRADLLQLLGAYAAPRGAPSDIPGLEYAGEVIAVGANVTRLRPGDRVMGLVGGGAFAEQVVAHEREVVRLPEGLSFEQAAAIPEAFLTAYDALVLQGGLRSGEVALVHAAASGVGTAALQIIKAIGATAIGTARSTGKLQRLQREFGLENAITVGSDVQFADVVKAASSGRGADVALELVGGSYLPETFRAMTLRGRVVLVGLLAGRSADVDLGMVLSKRLTLIGTVLRSRPAEEKITAALALERHVVPLFERGLLRPIVDEVVPFPEVRRGFERMQQNQSFGKIVLRW